MFPGNAGVTDVGGRLRVCLGRGFCEIVRTVTAPFVLIFIMCSRHL